MPSLLDEGERKKSFSVVRSFVRLFIVRAKKEDNLHKICIRNQPLLTKMEDAQFGF